MNRIKNPALLKSPEQAGCCFCVSFSSHTTPILARDVLPAGCLSLLISIFHGKPSGALLPLSDSLGHLARRIKHSQATSFRLLGEMCSVHSLVTFDEVCVKGQSSCVLRGSQRGTHSGAAVLKVGLTLSDGGNVGKIKEKPIAGAIKQLSLSLGQ